MPQVITIFKQLAASFVERSARGVAILIVRDATGSAAAGVTCYADTVAAQKDKAKYTADNYAAICDALTFAPYQVQVVRIGTDGTAADALDLVARNVKTGWVCFVDGTAEDQAALVGWIKAGEKKQRSYKAVVCKAATAPDSMHVVNFVNEKVTFNDERGEREGGEYLPSLCGMAAACNVERGLTNYLCSNLLHVEEVADNNAAVGKGQFVLINDEDGDVRVGVGVNSLTELTGDDLTEDMQYIDTVEAMDMIRDDVNRTYRTQYLGKYKNTQDYQMLFVGAVCGYLRALAAEDILDPDYANVAAINAAAQREAWVTAGKAEAAEWDDATVRAHPFKRSLFLAGDIKILNAMTHMQFVVTMF